MAACEVVVRRSAVREIRALPGEARRRVLAAIAALALEPRPRGCKRLAGRPAWRVRVGRYRVVYTVLDDPPVVTIARVAHRREAYR